MSVRDYEKAISLLAENGLKPIEVRRPSQHDIQRVEQRLGVTLPESYLRMLLDFGLLQVRSISISGLGNSGLEGTTASSVVFATENDRSNKLISKSMITIAFAGYGPFFVIDCSQLNENREAPVYEVPAGGISYGKDKVAEDFGSFLLKEVENILEPYDFELENEDIKSNQKKDVSEYWKARAKDFDDNQ
jgi:SMI1-KNR4 cell-wall